MTREEAKTQLITLKAKFEVLLSMQGLEVSDVFDMAIKALEQEPCEDAISRQAVLNGLASIAKAKAKSDAQKALMGRVMFFTEQLPPVTPRTKTGHWIEEDMFDGDVAYRCSECKELFWIESGTPKDNEYNFCPKCGAKMAESEEQT